MPKVSVIIPIYGVERYIEHCVYSLFEQTLDDIEFIFIDDCTPDNSLEILYNKIEEYQLRIAEKKWVVRIEQMPTNRGLAAIRRHGVQLAIGDYIIHCDSDDWVESTMYEKLYKEAQIQNADLIFCDYFISDDRNETDIKVFSKDITDFSRDGLLRRSLTESSLNPVWSVMAKRNLYNNIMFPMGSQSEDKTFVIQLCCFAEHACSVAEPLYHYRLASNSISRSNDVLSIKKRYQQLYDNREIIMKFMRKYSLESKYKKEIQAYLFDTKSILNPYINNPEIGKMWKESYPEISGGILFNQYVSFRKKIIYLKILLKLLVSKRPKV